MPTTQFRIGVNQYTTGKRGAEIEASRRGKKSARTRRVRAKERSRIQRELDKKDVELSQREIDRQVASLSEQAVLEDALAEAINTGVSNEFFAVFPNGDVVDTDTSEIVYELDKKEINQEYQSVYPVKNYGESLVDGLDDLISDYEQSDNRWVREKASALRDSFESADRDTMADNLAHMSSDFISYVQQVIEESGGNQNEVNNNYAKIVEIQALIEGRTLEMGSLRNDFAD